MLAGNDEGAVGLQVEVLLAAQAGLALDDGIAAAVLEGSLHVTAVERVALALQSREQSELELHARLKAVRGKMQEKCSWPPMLASPSMMVSQLPSSKAVSTSPQFSELPWPCRARSSVR